MLSPLDRIGAWRLLAPSARLVVAAAAPDVAHPTLRWDAADPATLVALAGHERCETALLALATAHPAGTVPPALLDALRARAAVAAYRAAALADAAAAAHDALHAAGIPALWLKGAALAFAAGDDGFTGRPMGDLDLLVDPATLPTAAAALEAAGFVAGDEAAYAAHHHRAPRRFRGDPAARLELHDALWPPHHPLAPLAPATLLVDAAHVTWRGRRAAVLPPALHLAHAATHWAWAHEGAVGSWQWLADARRLAPAVTPDALLAAADRLGARAPMGWALHVADLLVGLPAPLAAAATTLRPRLGPLLAGLAERQWIVRAFAAGPATPGVRWDRWWWRRSLVGLGDAAHAWPWRLGAGQVAPAPLTASLARATRPRWGPYLRRLRGLPA